MKLELTKQLASAIIDVHNQAGYSWEDGENFAADNDMWRELVKLAEIASGRQTEQTKNAMEADKLKRIKALSTHNLMLMPGKNPQGYEYRQSDGTLITNTQNLIIVNGHGYFLRFEGEPSETVFIHAIDDPIPCLLLGESQHPFHDFWNQYLEKQ